MPVVKPILYPANILEAAVLTMDPDGATPGKGVERLVDRDIGLECEDAGILGTRTWQGDQGIVAPAATDTWLFQGSGYAGKTVTLDSSADDITWVPRASIVPASDVVQRVALGSLIAARYWRMQVTGPDVPVRFTEWVLSRAVSLTFKPSAPDLREGVQPQVEFIGGGTGRTWGLKRGDRRWSHRYVMSYSPDTDRLLVLGVLDTTEDGAKPCYLLSVTGEVRWVRFTADFDFQAADRGVAEWDIPLTPVEELP